MRPKKKKRVIGYTDHLSLPDFGLESVPCKIDTGAYTATLHCSRVRILEKDEKTYLCFRLYDPKFGIATKREFRFRDYRERRVRSSNGVVELRYSIHTNVRIFNRDYHTEFTLSSREKMRFPILLGRRFLRSRFIVDVSQKDLSYKENLKEE